MKIVQSLCSKELCIIGRGIEPRKDAKKQHIVEFTRIKSSLCVE